MSDVEKPALDQIVDQVVANPGATWSFTKDGAPVAVVVSYDFLEDLRQKVGVPAVGDQDQQTDEFVPALERLINRYSQEAFSGTPDYILAKFLYSCLYAFGIAVRERERNLDHPQPE